MVDFLMLLLMVKMILFFVCLIFLFWREGRSLLWLKSRSYFISMGVESDEKGRVYWRPSSVKTYMWRSPSSSEKNAKILKWRERKGPLLSKASDECENLRSRLSLYFIFIVVVKEPDENSLRKTGFTLAPTSRLQTFIMGVKAAGTWSS